MLISGFLVTPELSGCSFGYVTHTDPRGRLPTWVSNKERMTFRLYTITETNPLYIKILKEPFNIQ